MAKNFGAGFLKKVFLILVLLFLVFGCVAENPKSNDSNSDLNKPQINLDNNKNSGSDSMKNVVEKGDTIKVDYTGTLENGEKFDSSIGREPLEFVAGTGQMIKGFDKAVLGMKLNEDKNIHLLPSEAYGEKNPALVQKMALSEFAKSGITPEIGMELQASGRYVTITALDQNFVTLDFNPKLAGKALNFWIKIVAIEKKK